jgi:hypothetical protein
LCSTAALVGIVAFVGTVALVGAVAFVGTVAFVVLVGAAAVVATPAVAGAAEEGAAAVNAARSASTKTGPTGTDFPELAVTAGAPGTVSGVTACDAAPGVAAFDVAVEGASAAAIDAASGAAADAVVVDAATVSSLRENDRLPASASGVAGRTTRLCSCRRESCSPGRGVCSSCGCSGWPGAIPPTESFVESSRAISTRVFDSMFCASV